MQEVKMIGIWEDEEVKALFKGVEMCKAKNKPIRDAFCNHAKQYARKPNSVRNYYYHEVDNLSADRGRCKRLGLDIDCHKKLNLAYFSKEEEAKLIGQIQALTAKGLSVRKACLTLANGDVDLLLRYQNKYRSYMAKQCKTEPIKSENVITFQKPSKGLSDSEVQSLFMGLVRLIKKNALIEGEEKYKQRLNDANSQLRKAIMQIQLQSREIDKIKQQFAMLKKENNTLAQSLFLARCNKAEKLREKLDGKYKEIEMPAGENN